MFQHRRNQWRPLILFRRTPAIRDAQGRPLPDSVAALERWRINDSHQWVLLRGHHRSLPLVLFLHGGPGDGQVGDARHRLAGLEAHALVVNWDQRGAGLSQHRSLRPESMTIEQILADAYAVITALLERFGRQRLILVGHSWGSILGLKLAQRHPDLIRHYIGVGQVTSIPAAEQAAYDWALTMATASGQQKAIQELTEVGRPPHATKRGPRVQKFWVSHFMRAVHRHGH